MCRNATSMKGKKIMPDVYAESMVVKPFQPAARD